MNKHFAECLKQAAAIVSGYRAEAPAGFDPQAVYPALLVGLAATAAGTGMSIAGNEESKAAMERARGDELQRQQQFRKEGQKRFDASMKEAGADRAKEDIEKAADTRQAAYQQMAQAPQGVTAPNVAPQGDRVVASPESGAQQRAEAANNAWSNLTSRAQAKLGAVGDWGLQRNIENKRANQDLALIANKSRGSLNVLPFEMDKASHEGDTLRTLGTVATALGSIGMMAGATSPIAATEAAPAITGEQAAAFGAGMGPVSAGYAGNVAPSLATSYFSRANPWSILSLGGQ